MKSELDQQLFSGLSPQVASQMRGGMWGQRRRSSSLTVVRFRYNPGGSAPGAETTTINLTNPRFDDGAIVNFPGDGGKTVVNIINADSDDLANLNLGDRR